jgi:hypothetical protein
MCIKALQAAAVTVGRGVRPGRAPGRSVAAAAGPPDRLIPEQALGLPVSLPARAPWPPSLSGTRWRPAGGYPLTRCAAALPPRRLVVEFTAAVAGDRSRRWRRIGKLEALVVYMTVHVRPAPRRRHPSVILLVGLLRVRRARAAGESPEP